MREWKAKVILQEQTTLGEGPIWWKEEQCLLWVDIEKERVGIYEPTFGRNKWINIGKHVGCVTPTIHRDRLLIACIDGFHWLEPKTGKINFITDPEENKRNNRFNDGKCDPWGNFWAGTMSYEFKVGEGCLWKLNHELKTQLILDQVTISNGLAWNKTERLLYFIDSDKKKIASFNLDINGDIINKNEDCIVMDQLDCGLPDGMTIDDEGMLWVAMYGQGCINRWNPKNGEKIGQIKLPCNQVTSCCFGGVRGNQLFITTARREMNSEDLKLEPLAGSLFVADVEVKGPPAVLFKKHV